jgi:arsenite-transporting ATPase
MSKVLMVAGKGGVGKTTVSAATGVAAAKKGHRTLILSFDLAHSLRDSFDLGEALIVIGGAPVTVRENLDIQEIDVQEELTRDWVDLYRYSASLMAGGGLDNVTAEEIAIVPGMEDIVALIRLNQCLEEDKYDVIVLDSPPTGEALRFVSITSTLEWYVRRRLKVDQRISSIMRPLAKLNSSLGTYLPDDSYFSALHRLFEKLEGIEDKLKDSKTTSIILVTNPEKMVVRETQRAFMYFCMYGMTVGSVVVNKMLPDAVSYFKDWADSQKGFLKLVISYFAPTPVRQIPLLSGEVMGIERLEEFARILYGDDDPTAIQMQRPAYGFRKIAEAHYRLEIPMPFAPKDHIDMTRKREDLVIRIGTFKRNILLPRIIAALPTAGARMEDGKLVVEFGNVNIEESSTATTLT